ncbi:MAG: hypothetical protein QXW10_00010 [Candidatus Micrarchaeaceae archaeon]
MFGKKQDSDGSVTQSAGRKNYSIVLTGRDKKLVYLSIAVILIVLALASLAVMSVKKTALQECSSIVLQQPKDNCYASLANATGNISICGFIPNENQANTCAYNIANAHNSIALCSYIKNSSTMQQCIYGIAVRAANETACASLSEPYMSSCIYNYAKLNHFSNISTCNAIQNTTLVQKCRYTYYYNSAMLYKSYNYCSSLPNATNSTVLSYIIPQNYSNYSNFEIGAEMAAFNITPQSYCYIELANETKNSSLCSFTSGMANELCQGIFALRNTTVALNETAACGNVPSYLKNTCIYGFISGEALAHDNISECLTISNLTYKDNCIYTMAYKYNQTSYCSYISNTTAMSACYQNVK